MKKSMSRFEEAINTSHEYGIVEEVKHPLVMVSGLPGVKTDELVVFSDDQEGYVLSLSKDYAEVLMLDDEPVALGSRVTRTDRQLMIPVSDGLRGKVIDPLGREMVTTASLGLHSTEDRKLDIEPPHIGQRVKINKQIYTGASLIDLMLPLGLGQRQAVLGDQKTGKTSFVFSALQSFAEENVVVYAAIGKPISSLAEASSFIQQTEAHENVITVASKADDVASMIILTPFAAITIAEYFRDLGHDVLLILDDLTTHAQFYREIALVGRRFPGRESYPGDIFHLHARLLERAGNFKMDSEKEASITCLPVAETVGSDLTSYIVSNLISITDGHILFDSTLFSQGQRPAVDTGLSVTRVGSQTQRHPDKDLKRELQGLLNRHRRAEGYAHFGTELNEEIEMTLDTGNKLKIFLSQPPYLTVPRSVQLVLGAMIWLGWMQGEDDSVAGQWRDRMVQQYAGNSEVRDALEEMIKIEDFNDFVANLNEKKGQLIDLCQSIKITSKSLS